MEIARILREISERELEEGGPYTLRGEKEPDYKLNRCIADFLELFGVRLPKVDAYLSQQDKSDTSLIRNRIRSLTKERLSGFPIEMRNRAFDMVEKIIARDSDSQITHIAKYVRDALGSHGEIISDEDIAQYGFENVLFWTSITIYDDFWDEDERADPRLLPIANLFAREFMDFYTHLFGEGSGFRKFFQSSMDLLDQANAWETRMCRMRIIYNSVEIPNQLPEFGSYENKFYPAIGHVFGPVAMLLGLGFAIDSEEITALMAYFKHYLIARQINDDLHDWKEHLAHGHASTVASAILAEWKAVHPNKKTIFLEHAMQELEHIFWYKVLTPLCATVLNHCAQSRVALKSIRVFENIAPLEKFILQSEEIAQKALIEQEQTTRFIEALQ